MTDRASTSRFQFSEARLAGWSYSVLLLLGFMSARAFMFVLVVTVSALLASAAYDGMRGQRSFIAKAMPIKGIALPFALFAAFCAWGASSTVWATIPANSVSKSASLTLVAGLVALGLGILPSRKPAVVSSLTQSLAVAYVVGAAILIVDYATLGAVKGWNSELSVRLSAVEFTRGATVLPLLMAPAIACARQIGHIGIQRGLITAIVVLGTVAAFMSPHETSQLAIVAAAIALGLSYVSLAGIRRLIAAGWVASCLMMLPASIFASQPAFTNASWLPISVTDRFVIWGGFADLATERPIQGHGANYANTAKPSFRLIDERLRERTNPTGSVRPLPISHPHNIYLQVWVELGAVGALLLAGFGLSMISAISKLTAELQPLGFATMAAVATQMLSSYSIWQYWFISIFGLAILNLAMAHYSILRRS